MAAQKGFTPRLQVAKDAKGILAATKRLLGVLPASWRLGVRDLSARLSLRQPNIRILNICAFGQQGRVVRFRCRIGDSVAEVKGRFVSAFSVVAEGLARAFGDG
jgi:hypothetical protein